VPAILRATMVAREYPVASVHPGSPMTEEYRSTLLRKLADQARAELVAAHTYSRWLPRTSDPEEKLQLVSLAHDETEHWYRAVKLMEELGVPADRVHEHQTHDVFIPLVRLLAGRIRWVDILMMSFLIDRAAYFLVQDFAESSYAPWAEMAKGILIEEESHSDFGDHFLRAQIEKLGRSAVQRALRKWWPVALNMCGPSKSPHNERYLRLGLKTRSNDERRAAYRQSAEAQISKLGLEVPHLYRNRYPFF